MKNLLAVWNRGYICAMALLVKGRIADVRHKLATARLDNNFNDYHLGMEKAVLDHEYELKRIRMRSKKCPTVKKAK